MPLYPPAGNVTGQASSVDSEISLFSGTTGKIIKRAANTGILKASSGVIATAVAGTDYLSGNQSISLTGDVTGSGTTSIACTIPANTIALADMATMATDSILGRATAATGNVEVLAALPWADTGDVTRAVDGKVTTLANIPLTTTIAGVAGTRGDVLYYGASGWAKLGAGTSGQQLTTGGAGADPTWAAAGSGGGGTPGGSTTQVQYNNASAFGGITGATTDGTTMTLTSPKIVTSVLDTNGNKFFDLTATSSAVNYLTLANNQSNFGPVLTATGSDTNINLNLTAKGTGSVAINSSGTRNRLLLNNNDATSKSSTFSFAQSGTIQWEIGNDVSANGGNNIYWYDIAYANTRFYLDGNTMVVSPPTVFGWNSAAAAALTSMDTGLCRNTGGVVEINNGTAGTYRDLKARTLNVTSDFQINGTSVAGDYINSSVASQSPSTSDVYLTGSNVTVPAGAFKAKGQYRCLFDVTKSAGTGGIVISVRTGTAGTTSDVANLTFTFPAGTSVADVGTFELFVNWRTVGSGTSAVVSGACRAQKNTVTAAGLWSDTSAAKTIVATVSGGFASNTFTNMGVSFNGGTAFAGTITTVQATLNQ